MNISGNTKWYKHHLFIFFVLFVIICVFYYDSVLDKGPRSTHIWRQTDCLSMTKNYYDGAPFFEPQLHLQLGDKNTSGKTAGEFPIIYFTVAQIWKITGVSYISYRIFYLLILMTGLFCFYQTLRIILKNNYWSIFLTFLLFTSPIFVVYGVSFLTDAPAFCFILISGYFLARYATDRKNKFFWLAIFFIALAGLIKISHLLFFGFLMGIFIVELFPLNTLGDRKFFQNTWHEYLGFLAVFISVFAWYSYAANYNEIHDFKYTFNDIFPIWLIEEKNIEPWIKGMKEVTTHTFFARPILFGFLFLGIFNLTLWKKIPAFAYFGNLFIILGSIIYFCLWGPLFLNHDYYYLALLILFPAIFIPFIYFIKTNHSHIFTGFYTKIFMAIFYVFHFIYCLQMIQLKTLAEKGNFIFVGNQGIVEEMRWINWDVKANWLRFEYCKTYMEEIGIKKDDLVISLPDPSFSISLYLMDHKGWTNFSNYNKEEQIQELINKGAKYLIISQPEIEKQEFLKKFIVHPIGNYKGLLFYKL